MTAIPDHGWAADADWPGNPFVHYITMDAKYKMQVAFMSIFVVPIRLVLMGTAILSCYFLSLITLINRNDVTCAQEPLRGWRRKCKDVCTFLFLSAHTVCGFYRIKVRGKRAEPWEAPILVMAPHSSLMDTLPVTFMGAPSFVGKMGLLKIPFISSIFLVTQPIFVDRACKDSRKGTVEKIQERARSLLENKDNPNGIGWPQVVIFPEGTTTNRSQLITFKPGAFLPQLPVQPVCLRWSNQPDTLSWTWEGLNCFQSFWLTLCQFENFLEIEFLPVYTPNEAEKNDAALFAKNVRAKMAECMQLPVSDYTLEDARYLTRNYSPKRTNFFNLCDELQVPYAICDDQALDGAWNLLKRSQWSELDYKVAYGQFAQEYLRLSESSKLQHMFNIFDWTCTGKIDLREFVIAQYANIYSYDSMKLCLEMFREQYTGNISQENFVRILRLPYGQSLKRCKGLYSIAGKEYHGDGKLLTVDTLRNVTQKYDEYESIFRFENNNNR